ncbi:DUF302 domain-containing protein [Occallatibacter savannae]|uniref:DUF302 domain-containing protein n=1 Tax=Occallatibacter savannae TaxID=1002691 RepID=UPI000D6910D1|nr:DUF302 domain-containing protein [Occallatibacter savannae]
MKNLAYTVSTFKSLDEAVAAIEENCGAHGFRVLHIHDLAAALAEKGFPRDPIKIVEVCNARYASKMLERDLTAALMMPCPIAVYQENGSTKISTVLPSVIAELLPGRSLEFTAEQVEFALLAIVNESAEEKVPLPVA